MIVPPGVFRPRSDTWLLARALEEHLAPGASVLDVCCGSGALAITAALARAGDVTAVDVSRRAIATTRVNARVNRVTVCARRGDLFAPVARQRFDVIVSNPPYLPADGAEPPRGGRERAWDAGPDGRALLERILIDAPRHLRMHGVLLLAQSSVTGAGQTLDGLREGGLEPSVVARRRGPLGAILAARAPALEARGLLRPGEREEELLVVRGRSGA